MTLTNRKKTYKDTAIVKCRVVSQYRRMSFLGMLGKPSGSILLRYKERARMV